MSTIFHELHQHDVPSPKGPGQRFAAGDVICATALVKGTEQNTFETVAEVLVLARGGAHIPA